jgi:hypothetical protein
MSVNNVRTEYRLAFGVDIRIDSADKLRGRIATILERGDFGSLTILFSSEGGSTDHSLELFNFISQLPVVLAFTGLRRGDGAQVLRQAPAAHANLTAADAVVPAGAVAKI